MDERQLDDLRKLLHGWQISRSWRGFKQRKNDQYQLAPDHKLTTNGSKEDTGYIPTLGFWLQ